MAHHFLGNMRRQDIEDRFTLPLAGGDDRVLTPGAGIRSTKLPSLSVLAIWRRALREAELLIIYLALLQLGIAPHQLYRPFRDHLLKVFIYRLKSL